MIPYALAGDYRVSTDCYASSIELPFFNMKIPVPAKYEEVLIAEYGSDYMTPVIGYRQAHEYPFYNKQRDSLRELLQLEFHTQISDDEMDDLIYQKIKSGETA